MDDQTLASLDELVEIRHGFAFKGEFFHDDPPGDVLLTPGNFAIGGGFQWGKEEILSRDLCRKILYSVQVI